MKNVKFLLSVLLLTGVVFAVVPANWVAATVTVESVDRVQRSMESDRGVLVFTFETVYQKKNRPLGRIEFWRAVKRGDRMQVKMERISGLWVVRRLNLLEAR